MTTARTTSKRKAKRHSPATPAPERRRLARIRGIARGVAGALRVGASSAATLVGHVPGAVRATRTGARDTASAMQTLPDSTLRWLAATSVGLGAGLRLARAPRIVVAAGVVPALLAGAAIALRPIDPIGSPEPVGDQPG